MLYKVVCSSRRHDHAEGLSIDVPVRQGLELKGQEVVRSLTRYLSDSPDVAFIALKVYHCDGVLSLRAGLPRSKDALSGYAALFEPNSVPEAIYIVSPILRGALIDIADCWPFDGSMDGEMFAPYLFVYHHRKLLKDLACQANGEIAAHVSCLLSYVETYYQADYDDADLIFAQQKVTPKHLAKLWIPNHILVSRKGVHDVAYVLAGWPEHVTNESTKRQSLRLRCWHWHYDGTELKRQYETFNVGLAGHAEMFFNKLVVFPLAFASEEMKDRLKERGQKFWN